jgi:hypothetical protein
MGTIAKGHAIAALVLGVIICFCGLLIIILSAVMAGKADVGAVLGPWWAGIMVSKIFSILNL